MSLSDYVENYYVSIMKLDKGNPDVEKFITLVRSFENSKPDNTFLIGYNEFRDYIRKSTTDYTFINLHFNRMRYHIQSYFNNDVILEYTVFVF